MGALCATTLVPGLQPRSLWQGGGGVGASRSVRKLAPHPYTHCPVPLCRRRPAIVLPAPWPFPRVGTPTRCRRPAALRLGERHHARGGGHGQGGLGACFDVDTHGGAQTGACHDGGGEELASTHTSGFTAHMHSTCDTHRDGARHAPAGFHTLMRAVCHPPPRMPTDGGKRKHVEGIAHRCW